MPPMNDINKSLTHNYKMSSKNQTTTATNKEQKMKENNINKGALT